MPLIKSAAAAVLTGGALWFLTGLVLNGLESKLMLVAKCVGLGAAAVVLYALLMLLTRQEDFLALMKRCKK